jgi:hypothetical protein
MQVGEFLNKREVQNKHAGETFFKEIPNVQDLIDA